MVQDAAAARSSQPAGEFLKWRLLLQPGFVVTSVPIHEEERLNVSDVRRTTS